MLNFKLVAKILGTLAFVETGLLLLCTLMSFLYEEDDLKPFLYATLIGFAIGALLKFLGRGAQNVMGRRDGYMIVCMSWILFCLVGMLPFLFTSHIKGVANAFFETMSGFTSTGATIMDNIDFCPHALLFWRSLTQWVGGLGIVLFTIAILPGTSSGNVKLFAAQSLGPLQGKLQPRIATTSKWILFIYFVLTICCTFSLSIAGMDWYDAVNHAFTCIGTGGFSTRQANVMFYQSPAIEYVLIIFMFLAGVNYNLLYFLLLKRQYKRLVNDVEFKWYGMIFLGVTLVCTLSLHFTSGYELERAFRSAAFQVISLYTSTGYSSDDYMLWAPCLIPFLLAVMWIGASSGSSAGGFKTIRLAMIYKVCKNELKKILHPNAILPLRINGQVVGTSVKMNLLAFAAIFTMTFFIGFLGLVFCGLDFLEAAGCCISCLSNVGTGYGDFGPMFSWSAMSDGAKWVCSALMYVGRLELLSVFLVVTPSFWRK